MRGRWGGCEGERGERSRRRKIGGTLRFGWRDDRVVLVVRNGPLSGAGGFGDVYRWQRGEAPLATGY